LWGIAVDSLVLGIVRVLLGDPSASTLMGFAPVTIRESLGIVSTAVQSNTFPDPPASPLGKRVAVDAVLGENGGFVCSTLLP
jgi:hypothetical protein